MRVVVQRVRSAWVTVNGDVVGEIGQGVVVLLGVSVDDSERDADYLVDKILNLRIFDDSDGKMNLSLLGSDGEMLVVSQFTLYGDTRRGRRPSYIEAAQPETANRLYEYFVSESSKQLARVATGKFQAMMEVSLINDGPVTILIDSKKNF